MSPAAEPKLAAVPAPARRIRIPKAAAKELAARYRARAEAEVRLSDFLAGIVLAKGIRLEDVTGFNDVTCELLLGDGQPPS